ncbi:MAG: hypothetical protein U0Y96_02595 [Candidatus Kapaibacterium sp.]|nr:hypothetical protein [Bacteroidota bacterium]
MDKKRVFKNLGSAVVDVNTITSIQVVKEHDNVSTHDWAVRVYTGCTCGGIKLNDFSTAVEANTKMLEYAAKFGFNVEQF